MVILKHFYSSWMNSGQIKRGGERLQSERAAPDSNALVLMSYI